MDNKILLVGDSLTAGILGISYARILEKQFPLVHFTIKGKNGDTIKGIFNRLIKLLRRDPRWDAIVIEGGHNDLLLPVMRKRNKVFEKMTEYLVLSGAEISSPREFPSALQEGLKEVRNLTDAPLIQTTMSCLGEDLSSELNRKRAALNKHIRQKANKNKVHIAEIAEAVDKVLKNEKQSSYLYDQNADLITVSPPIIDLESWACERSRKRGLILTVDGVHVNSDGAAIYAREIENQLKKTGILSAEA